MVIIRNFSLADAMANSSSLEYYSKPTSSEVYHHAVRLKKQQEGKDDFIDRAIINRYKKGAELNKEDSMVSKIKGNLLYSEGNSTRNSYKKTNYFNNVNKAAEKLTKKHTLEELKKLRNKHMFDLGFSKDYIYKEKD